MDHRYHVTNFSEMNLKVKRQCQLLRFDVIFVILCELGKRFVITCFGGTLLVFGISLKSVLFALTTVFAKLFVVIEFSDKFELLKRKRLLFSGAVLFVAEYNETGHLMLSVNYFKPSVKKS